MPFRNPPSLRHRVSAKDLKPLVPQVIGIGYHLEEGKVDAFPQPYIFSHPVDHCSDLEKTGI